MMSYFLNFELTEDSVRDFINSIENYISKIELNNELNNELNYPLSDLIDIYIDCPGGINCYATALYVFFTKYSIFKFHIIGSCSSSSFFLMLALNNVVVYPTADSTIHTISFETRLRDIYNKDHTEYRRVITLKDVNNDIIKILKEVLPSSIYKRFSSNKDAHISGKELFKIFNYVNENPEIKQKIRKIFEF